MIHSTNPLKKISVRNKLTIIVVVCFFWLFQVEAQNELFLDPHQYNAAQIDAAYNNNQLLTVNDPEAGQSNLVTLEGNSYIKIWVDTDKPPYNKWFTYTITLSVTPLSSNGQPSSISHSRKLTVEYNPYSAGGQFIDLTNYEITNYRGAHIRVTNVSYKNMDTQQTFTQTPLNIMLETGIRVNRFYSLSPNPINVGTPSITNGEIKFNWNATAGALSYDLEWTWVDSYGEETSSPRLPGSISLSSNEFRQNSTRINTKQTNYSIPNIYSNSYLVYRVRAVGVHLNNTSIKKFGPWSHYNPNPTLLTHWRYVGISNSEPLKNWQFQASYAEEGKRKDVVSYFDGTLRNRQTVTKINSDNNAIVGEVIYDNQGRPAIEILPVPADNDQIKYYPNFNKSSNPNSPTVYNHNDFDWDKLEECNLDLLGLSTQSGAGKYYSPNYSTGDYNDFTPSAVDPDNNQQGFPFSQIEYSPDNTGRIARKSGVGVYHQLGSGHEMKYYYATPEQVEIDRLFGYSVGLVQHYKKNVVVDPNGQVSVSYIDPQGRTIATALAGVNPEMLDGLWDEEQGPHESFTVNLLNNGNGQNSSTNYAYSTGNYGVLMDGWRYEAQKVCVANSTQYEFGYNLHLPEQAYWDDCLPPGQGYPYVFDLVLDITDPCDSSFVPNGSKPIAIGNYTALAYGGGFNLIPISPSYSFSKTIGPPDLPLFNIGNFGITKKLEVNNEALDYFANDYINQIIGTDCVIALNLEIDDSGCFYSCEECLYALVGWNLETDPVPTEDDYVLLHIGANYTGFPSWSELNQMEQDLIVSMLKIQWQELKAICMAPCGIDGVSFDGSDNFETSSCINGLAFMLSDMQPTGQYGTSPYTVTDENGNQTSVTRVDDPEITNIFSVHVEPDQVGNKLFYNGSNSYLKADWQHPYHYLLDTNASEIGHYYTTGGDIAYVPLEKINDQFVPSIRNGAPVQMSGEEGDEIYRVEPHYLENPEDFLSLWQNHWAESLVIYHPEYHYYEYSRELCNLTNVLNYTDLQTDEQVTATMNSDGYDLFLQTLNYESAESLGIFTGINILDKDPYFLNNHPYDPSEANDQTNEPGWKRAIMEEALINSCDGCQGYDGNGKTIAQMAYILVFCNSIDAGCSAPTTDVELIAALGAQNVTNAQRDQFWITYMSNYLSLKQKVQYILLNIYAFGQGGYNGCIETETTPNSILDVIQPYQAKGSIQGYISANSPTGPVLCEYEHASIYNQKKKRYIPIDFLYPSEEDNETIAEGLENLIDYTHYTNTGQCPMARDMEMFLNGIATIPPNQGNLIFNFVNTSFAFTGQYISPDLFADFGGEFPNPYGPLQINTTVNGQLMTIGFQNPNLNNVVKLILLGTYSWSNYGSSNGWMIEKMSEVYYLPNSYDPQTETFDFLVKARVRDIQAGVIQPSFSEVLLQGTTVARVGECGLLSDGHTGPGEIIGGGDGDIPSPCQDLLLLPSCLSGISPHTAARGIYRFDVYIGNQVGDTIKINYDGIGEPDRFEIFFDGHQRDDSMWVSDNCSLLLAYNGLTDNLEIFQNSPYLGNHNNFVPTGQFRNVSVDAIATNPCSRTGTLSFVKDSPTQIMTVQVTGINSNNSWAVTMDCEYVPCFNTNSGCITQTVEPLSCTDKYQEFITGISNISDYITIPNPLDEEYFCNMNFAYITDGYLDYLNILEITDVANDHFITIGEFGATGLRYGYNDYLGVINDYKIHIRDGGDKTWAEFVDAYLIIHKDICLPAPMIPSVSGLPEDDMNDCQEFVFNITQAYGSDAYYAYIEYLKKEFKQGYIASAMTSVEEALQMTYDDKEYQYTLYYYDQAGNLNKTVAPEGVNRFEKQYLEGGTQDLIIQTRNANDQNPAALPAHKFETSYKYNSLNQLVQQFTPDGGQTLFAYDKLGRIIASQNENQRNLGSRLILMSDSPKNYTFPDIGSSIVKNTNGWHGGYGVDILEGNGSLSFVVDEEMHKNFEGFIGVSYASNEVMDPKNPYQNISYGVYCIAKGGETSLEFFDHGKKIDSEKLEFKVGDTISIERTNGYVNMYLNGGNPIVEVQEKKFNEPLRIDFALHNAATAVHNLSFKAYDPGYQLLRIPEAFSYTKYDGLGRITEAGEIRPPKNYYKITEDGRLENVSTALQLDEFPNNYIRREVTHTYYDRPAPNPCSIIGTIDNVSDCVFENCDRQNLRNRVSGILYYDMIAPSAPMRSGYDNAIYYCYDIHGNVKEIVNYFPELRGTGNDRHFKRVNYDYDLISGNVKQVNYQKGKNDQFSHRYTYDADNRIIAVETSSDQVVWEKDAKYNYYEHGPLARMVLGEKKVQGSDYVYTLQGWLKAVNGEYLGKTTNHDFGSDGYSSGNPMVARDALAYSLGYFDGDYTARNAPAGNDAFVISNNFSQNPAKLYNGNIRQMVTSLRESEDQVLYSQFNHYRYDQLNRIKSMNSKAIGQLSSSHVSYSSSYAYDKNGNIDSLKRFVFNAATLSNPIKMDDLTYTYKDNNNQLTLVNDKVLPGVFPDDLDDQTRSGFPYDQDELQSHNYIYDEIGQLILDRSERLRMEWRVDGKVKRVLKYGEANMTQVKEIIEFDYDGLGNRVSKKVVQPVEGIATGTFYMRDAQGNVLSVMESMAKKEQTTNNYQFTTLNTKEHHIFGSSRLGLEQKKINSLGYSTPRFETADSDLSLKVGADAKGEWFIKPFENEPKNTPANYLLAGHLILTQALPINDSIQVSSLFFSSMGEKNPTQGNELELYIKNTGNDYRPYIVTRSIEEGEDIIEVHTKLLPQAEGISETEILTVGMKFQLQTEYNLKQNDVQLVINDRKYTSENELSITKTSWKTGTQTVDPFKLSTLGDTHSTFAIEEMYYLLTTSFNKIEDYWSLRDGNGNPRSKEGNVMELTGTRYPWTAGVFPGQLGKKLYQRMAGDKRYELSNHLGNVLSVVSDKKIPKLAGSALSYFNADIKAYNDYYPFGMLLPGRHANTVGYRYGFQGQEMDDEIKGEGNSVNYTFRMHDPRVGRFFAVDPLFRKYARYSPYSFSANQVIHSVELEGLETYRDLMTGLDPVYTQMVENWGPEEADRLQKVHDEQFFKTTVGGLSTIGLSYVTITGAFSSITWVMLNPVTAGEIANETTATAWGLMLDDPYPGPAVGDDLMKLAKNSFKKLAGENPRAIAEVSRTIYDGLKKNIPDYVRSLKIPLKQQAEKAHQLRNKAKEIVREASGPELRKQAEEHSAKRYNGQIYGETFKESFDKRLKEAHSEGLEGNDAINRAYNKIIDSSPRGNKDLDKEFLKKNPK